MGQWLFDNYLAWSAEHDYNTSSAPSQCLKSCLHFLLNLYLKLQSFSWGSTLTKRIIIHYNLKSWGVEWMESLGMKIEFVLLLATRNFVPTSLPSLNVQFGLGWRTTASSVVRANQWVRLSALPAGSTDPLFLVDIMFSFFGWGWAPLYGLFRYVGCPKGLVFGQV